MKTFIIGILLAIFITGCQIIILPFEHDTVPTATPTRVLIIVPTLTPTPPGTIPPTP